MALETKDFQKKHQFTFSRQLVFEDKHFEALVKENCRPSPEEVELGKTHFKKIQEGYMPKCRVEFISEDVGHGLFSECMIPKGSFVGEYTGLVCENINYMKMNNYLFRYPVEDKSERYLSIDAEPYGNHTRFINHSFTPNLNHHYAFSEHLFHLIFIANKDIQQDEQFSFNYGHGYWYLRGAPEAL